MNTEDLLVLGLAGVVVFMFTRQQSQAAVQAGPTTPQGTSYPLSTVPPAPSTSQSTPTSTFPFINPFTMPGYTGQGPWGGKFYIDPSTGKTVVCPAGQVVVDIGDIVAFPGCGTPGTVKG